MITISIWNQEIKAAKIARSNFNIEDLKNILSNISYGGLDSKYHSLGHKSQYYLASGICSANIDHNVSLFDHLQEMGTFYYTYVWLIETLLIALDAPIIVCFGYRQNWWVVKGGLLFT